MDRASQGEPPKTGAMQEKAPALESQRADAAKPAQTAPKQGGPVAVEPVPPPAPPPTTASPNQSAAKPEAPAAKLPAQARATPAPTDPAPKMESRAPGPEKPPAPPPLDLTSLEKRLKETDAIGVFTKLTLKNQVDALLDKFREYYQGRIRTTLAQLRQPYDQLLLKVLSLLQDRDPPLARAIAQSREAIWGILSDPDKFKYHLMAGEMQ
jgi:hypothetical protein